MRIAKLFWSKRMIPRSEVSKILRYRASLRLIFSVKYATTAAIQTKRIAWPVVKIRPPVSGKT